MKRISAQILSACILALSVGAKAQSIDVNKIRDGVRRLWAPLKSTSELHQFVKLQLAEILNERGLKLIDESLVVKPYMASKPLSIIKSTVNVEYQFFADLKDYSVSFVAVDQHQQVVTGSTYLTQTNCQEVVDNIHEKFVDCDSPQLDKRFGVFGEKSHGRILVGLVNEPMAVRLPNVLDLNLH